MKWSVANRYLSGYLANFSVKSGRCFLCVEYNLEKIIVECVNSCSHIKQLTV